MNNTLAVLGMAGGVASLVGIVWTIVQSVRGKEAKKRQAEAAKATIDAEAAEAAKPHVEKALELGNFGEALSIQQGVINGLREHMAWQDHELEERAKENRELREQHAKESRALREELNQKDQKVAELMQQLNEATESLRKAWDIIKTLQPDPKRGRA